MPAITFPLPLVGRAVAVALVILAANAPDLVGQTAQEQFYKAYYLQHARSDAAGAAELYADAISGRELPVELRAAAKHGLAVCREELATTDFARLMPPAPLAYIEINRPGERLSKLIDQLGLLASPEGPAASGQNQLAISPAVIDAILGIRGVAVAVTGFNPATEQPSGVAVIHPGDVELIRGLIETALPVQSEIVEPIGGYPTYFVEEVYVTLTKRLVIVGTGQAEIAGVVDRLRDADEPSLATSPQLAEVLEGRDGALLYFCVNPKPLLPLINMMTAGASQCREMALAQALLDLPSFQSLTGRFDISDEGLVLKLALHLDEGHRNLVYNFLRRPALDPETLRCVPVGAAGFVALAMNDTSTTYRNPALSREAARPVVTALDLGRELFANIEGIAVFALPPGEADGPIPNVAAVITVNDPAQSEALWTQILGVASLATGAASMEGETSDIAGVTTRGYSFEDKVTVYVGMMENDLLIGSTKAALGRAIEAKKSGRSIADDPVFAGPLAQIGSHTTLAVVAHPARCVEIARPFMSASDLREAEPIIALMKDTTACVAVDHGDRILRVSAAVGGIPDISGLVSKMLAEQRQRGNMDRALTRSVKSKDWSQALELLDQKQEAGSDGSEVLQKKFEILAVHKGDSDAARALADQLYEAMSDDAMALNNFAWALLTEQRYQHQFNEMALRLARRSNELTDHENWAYLDTLALAEFETGNAKKAVELEKKAIELCQRGGSGGVDDLKKTLARFRESGEQEY